MPEKSQNFQYLNTMVIFCDQLLKTLQDEVHTNFNRLSMLVP